MKREFRTVESRLRVAAYQPPLLAPGSMEALGLIRRRVEQCEAEGVMILCCPEAILGGLADYGEDPASFAIPTWVFRADVAGHAGALVSHGGSSAIVDPRGVVMHSARALSEELLVAEIEDGLPRNIQ